MSVGSLWRQRFRFVL